MAKNSGAGLILRERDPVNLEYPFDRLEELLTPNHLFYVRNHFPVPALDTENYRLTVEGAVEQPFSLSYRELTGLPAVTRLATLECAGNGRVFLSPQAAGAQWQQGAVSTAEWTGVALPVLLERARPMRNAQEIVFEAADHGAPRETPRPPGEITYARSVVLDKLNDVLIAYRMNGEPLSPDHGFPVRVVVPGYYGMASVKWLTRIRAVTEPFQGFWQTSDYAYWDDSGGHPVRRPLNQMALKSAIARPRLREHVAAGETYPVFGAAWAGDAGVEGVEVSTDNGASWQEAGLLDPPQPFVWRRWEFAWKIPEKPGMYVLRSRARDGAGKTQPEQHDERFGSYVIHHTFGIEVFVD